MSRTVGVDRPLDCSSASRVRKSAEIDIARKRGLCRLGSDSQEQVLAAPREGHGPRRLHTALQERRDEYPSGRNEGRRKATRSRACRTKDWTKLTASSGSSRKMRSSRLDALKVAVRAPITGPSLAAESVGLEAGERPRQAVSKSAGARDLVGPSSTKWIGQAPLAAGREPRWCYV